MNIRKMVMAEAGAEGAGAGGSVLTAPPIASPKVDSGQQRAADGTGAASGTPVTFSLPDKWQSSLPEDLRNEPSIQMYTDMPTFVKSFVNAQKAIGQDKVVIPGKHATEKDWSEFYKKVGAVPESLEKYDFKPPEIFKADVDSLNKLKTAAYEANVSPKAFQKLIDLYGEDLKGQITKNEVAKKAAMAKDVELLKTEWGVKYTENIKTAQRALDKFGDPGLKKVLEDTGLGNHPALIKAFKNMGASLAEDTIERGGAEGSGSGLMTPAEAMKKANAILADHSHPYHTPGHPNNKAAKDEVSDLFKMAYPE